MWPWTDALHLNATAALNEFALNVGTSNTSGAPSLRALEAIIERERGLSQLIRARK